MVAGSTQRSVFHHAGSWLVDLEATRCHVGVWLVYGLATELGRQWGGKPCRDLADVPGMGLVGVLQEPSARVLPGLRALPGPRGHPWQGSRRRRISI